MWSYYLTKIFRLSLPAINHAQPEDHPASLHFYTLHHHNLLPATAGIKLKVRWWAACTWWWPCAPQGPGKESKVTDWTTTDRRSMLVSLFHFPTSSKSNMRRVWGQPCLGSRRRSSPGPMSTTWTSTPSTPRWCLSTQVPQVSLTEKVFLDQEFFSMFSFRNFN